MNWEDTFRTWGSPPSKTEQEKMENAEASIKKAIDVDPTLTEMDISVFAQGSYKSRTSVRQDSDVDVCVCLNSTFFPRYPAGKTKEDFGNIDGSISFADYKDLIENALNNYFSPENVFRGNKAFD
ncbi:MAG: nucleotidyltransferase, partial [Candidatus Dadabacteria bacterium]|nr:nucleotidyltransferase [Candidatus Dadabacteria bacterium]